MIYDDFAPGTLIFVSDKEIFWHIDDDVLPATYVSGDISEPGMCVAAVVLPTEHNQRVACFAATYVLCLSPFGKVWMSIDSTFREEVSQRAMAAQVQKKQPLNSFIGIFHAEKLFVG